MRRIWLIFSQAVTVAVAVLFVVGTFKPEWLQRGGALGSFGPRVVGTPDSSVPVSLAQGASPAQPLSAAARKAAPAVVSVTASKAPAASDDPRSQDPWFRFFFGQRGQLQPQEPQVGLGSGVIVSPEGYLLTNNHVIDGADDIRVRLSDGREAQAKLVGTDPESDVAVLKIELERLKWSKNWFRFLSLAAAAATVVVVMVTAVGFAAVSPFFCAAASLLKGDINRSRRRVDG